MQNEMKFEVILSYSTPTCMRNEKNCAIFILEETMFVKVHIITFVKMYTI